MENKTISTEDFNNGGVKTLMEAIYDYIYGEKENETNSLPEER